jgi:hypothetical protein
MIVTFMPLRNLRTRFDESIRLILARMIGVEN